MQMLELRIILVPLLYQALALYSDSYLTRLVGPNGMQIKIQHLIQKQRILPEPKNRKGRILRIGPSMISA